VHSIAELIRFVVAPDGAVVPDIKNRLPGRGVWVSADAKTLRQAVDRKAFARAFKRSVETSADLVADTERLLAQAALDSLSMAYKAGLVVPGFAKTERTLEQGAAAGLIQAAEAAPDGVRKLASAHRRGAKTEAKPFPLVIFAGSQLDLALGRANVIHAALLAGPASETLLARYYRLERFRGGEPAKLAED
jgi:predicted RNA-binding protein YlxR (DUF448 family)